MTLAEIIIKNLEWIVLGLVGGIVAYTTFKIKFNALVTDVLNLREATRDSVAELKTKLDTQADVIHELRRKQDSLEAEIKYGKETIERQLTLIEGHMHRINTGGTNNG